MGVRNATVRVRRGELFMEAEIFCPIEWKWEFKRFRGPVQHLVLTEPVLGKKGGFKYAELRQNGSCVWLFMNENRRGFERVKKILAKSRK